MSTYRLGRDIIRVRDCDGPATGVPAALAAAFPPPPALRALGERGPPGSKVYTIRDHGAALARRVPGGFAGAYTEGGRPVLRLVDPSLAEAAKAALAGWLPPRYDVTAAEPRAARWDFAQLYDWYKYLKSQPIWTGHRVTMSTIDPPTNRLYVGTLDHAARDRLAGRLAALELPCDLVLVGVTPAGHLERG